MSNAKKNEIMKKVMALNAADKQSLIDDLLAMLQGNTPKEESCSEMVQKNNAETPSCPHCGQKAEGSKIIRRGRNKNGAQRFYCKECGRFFTPSTNTAFAYTRKSADKWRKFIEMTIMGESLASCAEACEIAYQTAFTWRHKILNVFSQKQNDTKMTGMVEADEMMIPLSYKGNHVHGSFGTRKMKAGAINDMPRKAYRRGSDNKSMSSKDKACVFCMVENGDKAFFAGVPGVGFMNEAMLNATVAKHVERSSALMLVDQYKVTKNYLDVNSYDSLVLASNTSDNPHDHKPEVQGKNREKHMQHVNSMHQHIRMFLRPYCGVSSKYLANYVSLFVWLKNNSLMRQRKNAFNIAEECISKTPAYIPQRTIQEYPAVPCCA